MVEGLVTNPIRNPGVVTPSMSVCWQVIGGYNGFGEALNDTYSAFTF